MDFTNFLVRIATGLSLALTSYLIFWYASAWVLSLLILLCLAGMMYELQGLIKFTQSPKIYFFICTAYLVIPTILLICCNHHYVLRIYLAYLVVLVAVFDSFSYLIGSLASHMRWTYKIAPSISPGKSWQGFVGGFCITTSVAYYFFIDVDVNSILFICINFLFCITALAGDLFESYLKRCVGVKDSGLILPGHGGMLDRFDGLLFASYWLIFLIFR